MDDVLVLIGGEAGIRIIGVIVTVIFLFGAIAWSRSRMGKLGANWQDFAAQHGLQYSTSSMTYDYGGVVGSHSFDFPGMVGNYRGRSVQVFSGTGLSGAEAGKWLLESTVQLNQSKPYSALAYKRRFEEIVKSRIQKDSKTGNRDIDSKFKIRTEDERFVESTFSRVNFGDWLKQEKYHNAHLIVDGDKLVFRGAVKGYKANPEQALALLNILCDIADNAH